MKRILYFGCGRGSGHYLWVGEWGKEERPDMILGLTGITITKEFIHHIDGKYVPKTTNQQGAYRETMEAGFRIIGWHDYTVDRRQGSNSVFIGVGYESAAELLDDARNFFPSVMLRQTVPLHPMP